MNGKPKKKERLSERFCRRFDLPADIVSGGLTLELRGRSNLLLCGCREILAYSTERIRLRLSNGQIEIWGRSLVMTVYYEGQTGIDGEIYGINLCPDCEARNENK
jgi:sporulation protein YqfC